MQCNAQDYAMLLFQIVPHAHAMPHVLNTVEPACSGWSVQSQVQVLQQCCGAQSVSLRVRSVAQLFLYNQRQHVKSRLINEIAR